MGVLDLLAKIDAKAVRKQLTTALNQIQRIEAKLNLLLDEKGLNTQRTDIDNFFSEQLKAQMIQIDNEKTKGK